MQSCQFPSLSGKLRQSCIELGKPWRRDSGVKKLFKRQKARVIRGPRVSRKCTWKLVILFIWGIGNFYINILLTSWKSERFVIDGEEGIFFEREERRNKGGGLVRWLRGG